MDINVFNVGMFIWFMGFVFTLTMTSAPSFGGQIAKSFFWFIYLPAQLILQMMATPQGRDLNLGPPESREPLHKKRK